MVMNMWIFTILYFLEIFTDFVDKVTDRISKISFTSSRDVPVEISKSQEHTNSAVGKSCVMFKLDSGEEDGSCMTENNFRCCPATTPAETRKFKVSRWNKLYNNLKIFFRNFRINRKL